MEINAEINKVFGQEMVKLFAEQITEEELRTEAIKSYNKLRAKGNNYWANQDSEFDIYLKKAILERYKEEVNKYLETEQLQIDILEEARKLVDEIREKARHKIIENASDAILNIYRGNDMARVLNGVIDVNVIR